MSDRIPLIEPVVGEPELDNVRQVVESGYMTQGPFAAEFEEGFADLVGATHAVTVTSCTTGMELALDALGVDAGLADDDRPALHEPACYLRARSPAHDVVGPDGRKLSGNAQHRTREAVVQHGSLLHAVDPARHVAPFAADLDPGAVRDRVGAVSAYADVDRAETVAAVEAALGAWTDAEPGGWTDAELSRARELAAERFGAEAWVRRRPGR